jgi:CO dehydrogenase nickel-insertion accessory protein CooC1
VDALLIVVSDNPLSLHSAQSILEITGDLDNRIRHQSILTNLINDSRKQKIHDRLKPLQTEILCDLPFDEKLEDIIYEGKPVGELTDSPLIDYIETILDRIGGNNGNS